MSLIGKNKYQQDLDPDPDPPPDYYTVCGPPEGGGDGGELPIPNPTPKPVTRPQLPTRRNEVGTNTEIPRARAQSRRQSRPRKESFIGHLGGSPVLAACPNCGHQVETQTYKSPSACAWISCVMIGFLFSSICCFVPLCLDSCKDVHHSCPHCGEYLGTHRAEC